jgi:hypothetical protein
MSEPTSRSRASRIVEAFATEGRLSALEPQRGGHINESWVATCEGPGSRRRYLLQHVNRYVFRQPELVMANMLRVTHHVAAHVAEDGLADPERRALALVPTRGGSTHHREADGEVWRLVPWIEGTRSTERAESPAEARATAEAFGHFLRQLADLPAPPLHETIPGFHDTPARFEALERAVADDEAGRVAGAREEIEALLDRRSLGRALTDRVEDGCASWTSTPSCPGSRSTTSGTWSDRW